MNPMYCSTWPLWTPLAVTWHVIHVQREILQDQQYHCYMPESVYNLDQSGRSSTPFFSLDKSLKRYFNVNYNHNSMTFFEDLFLFEMQTLYKLYFIRSQRMTAYLQFNIDEMCAWQFLLAMFFHAMFFHLMCTNLSQIFVTNTKRM